MAKVTEAAIQERTEAQEAFFDESKKNFYITSARDEYTSWVLKRKEPWLVAEFFDYMCGSLRSAGADFSALDPTGTKSNATMQEEVGQRILDVAISCKDYYDRIEYPLTEAGYYRFMKTKAEKHGLKLPEYPHAERLAALGEEIQAARATRTPGIGSPWMRPQPL